MTPALINVALHCAGRVVPLIAIPTARLAHGRELGGYAIMRKHGQNGDGNEANFRGSKVSGSKTGYRDPAPPLQRSAL